MNARLLTAMLCAGCILALPASAQAHESGSVTVRAGDLDLSTDAGALRLLRRLDHAVERVCGGALLQQFAAARRAYQRCYAQTMAQALAQVEAPRVHAHYAERLARRAEARRARLS